MCPGVRRSQITGVPGGDHGMVAAFLTAATFGAGGIVATFDDDVGVSARKMLYKVPILVLILSLESDLFHFDDGDDRGKLLSNPPHGNVFIEAMVGMLAFGEYDRGQRGTGTTGGAIQVGPT